MNAVRTKNLKKLIEWCDSNSVELLEWDGKYRGNFTFINKSGAFSGYTGSCLFETAVKSGGGQFTGFQGLLESEIRRYVGDALNNAGAQLVSFEAGSVTKSSVVEFIVISGRFTGCSGSMKVSHTLNGDFRIQFHYLHDSSKKAYFDKISSERMYKIIEYPKMLSEKCILLSPKGNEWSVVWNSFDVNGNNCPDDSHGEKMSYGEKVISLIFLKNGIDYCYQKTIKHKDERWQYMDFYLEYCGKKYCVEYNGIQHYSEVEYFRNNTLDDIIARDNRKIMYCKDNNIEYIVVPHTKDTVSKVFKVLSKHFQLDNKPSARDIVSFSSCDYSDADVVDYFKNHSQNETAEKFSISTQKLYVICKRIGYKKVDRYVKVLATNIITNESLVFESIKLATEYTGVDVRGVFRSKNKENRRKNWVFKKI